MKEHLIIYVLKIKFVQYVGNQENLNIMIMLLELVNTSLMMVENLDTCVYIENIILRVIQLGKSEFSKKYHLAGIYLDDRQIKGLKKI